MNYINFYKADISISRTILINANSCRLIQMPNNFLYNKDLSVSSLAVVIYSKILPKKVELLLYVFINVIILILLMEKVE